MLTLPPAEKVQKVSSSNNQILETEDLLYLVLGDTCLVLGNATLDFGNTTLVLGNTTFELGMRIQN